MLKRTMLAKSLLIAFSATALTAAVVPTAYAQSNATGQIFGQVTAGTGTSVAIESTATGLKRSAAIDASGRFQATALPPGSYRVQLLKGTAVVSTVQIEVLVGQGVEAVFASAAQLQTVQIIGRAPSIDVSSTNNGTNFTARQLDALPIATKDLNSIIALAPNTTRADPRYAGGISIGGGAPSENAFYINGFPVTNALTQLGSIELPFGAIAQAQVLTGGFGAEFGRSVGGVVNLITKSGTNEWKGGVSYSIEPNSLRSTPKSSYYPQTGANAPTDGTIYLDRSNNSRTSTAYGAYIGGPIIQDKLFLFVAAEKTTTKLGYVNAYPTQSTLGTSGFVDEKDTNDRYLAKFDWNLTDDHRLELTLLGDNYKARNDNYGYSYATGQKSTGVTYTGWYKNVGEITPAVGGEAQILKYTGNITPDLTLTALYGQSTSKHSNKFNPPADSSSPQIIFNTTTARAPGLTYVNPQVLTGTVIPEGAEDRTKSFRLDLEWRLNKHTLRVGLDENRLKSKNAGEEYAGGGIWRYFKAASGATVIGTAGGSYQPQDGGGLGTDGYYVRNYLFNDATGAESNQSAQFIEDKYQVTKNILVTAGLRNESFTNKNGDGETFLKSKNFVSPRLAASWDVLGDSSLQVFGSAGRYSLQIPTHIAVRGASRSTLTRQDYTYTGVDPVTGVPTGLTDMTGVYSVNNELGQAKDVNVVSALDLKPTYQDELTLGFKKALASTWTTGASLTYRTLKATIDDECDYRPFLKYAADHGIDTTNYAAGGCASFNPGMANSFLVDYAGTGSNYTTVNLSAAELGFPKARRTYLALDLFLEHPFSSGWYGKVNYTYSRSKGNTEGQTKSDNAQTDVAATSTWDTPELMENISGLLPNNRTHQIKAFGYYQITPEWAVGGNVLAQSGRPKSCVGNYGYVTGNELDGGNLDYGSVYFFCGGVASPRGSQGRLPWETSLDMNLVYKPAAIKGLALRFDIFNLLNRQSVLVVDETHEAAGDPTSVSQTYGRVMNYSAPRKVRLSVEYNF